MSLPDPDEMFRRYQEEHDAEVARAERERIIKLLEDYLCCLKRGCSHQPPDADVYFDIIAQIKERTNE